MTSTAAKPRLAFLDRASQLLATASPAVSAELQSTRRDLEGGLQVPVRSTNRPLNCVACGSILVPGWNSTFYRDPQTPRRTRQDRINKKMTNKTVKIQCSQCNSITTFDSQKPNHSKIQKPSNSKPAAGVHLFELSVGKQQAPQATPTPPAGDSGSKKRSRNKKSSLQSMLADRKMVAEKKAPGLNLMDFMKT